MPTWRRYKDRFATIAISAGGASVLMAILLIFFYLMYEVLPLFSGAQIEKAEQLQLPAASGRIIYAAMEEQGEVGFVIDENWRASFFTIADGELIQHSDLGREDVTISSLGSEGGDSRLLALAYTDGTIKLLKHEYKLSYPDGLRFITPRLEALYEEADLNFDGQVLKKIAVRDGEEALLVSAVLPSGELVVKRFNKEIDFLSDELEFSAQRLLIPALAGDTAAIHIGFSQRWLYRLSKNGRYVVIDLLNKNEAGVQLVADSGELFQGQGGTFTSSALLLGGISLLVASSEGDVAQFFMARVEEGNRLQHIRSFDTGGNIISTLIPEHRRKGFIAITDTGLLQVFHSTAHRKVLEKQLLESDNFAFAAISPRANKLLVGDANLKLQQWHIDNEHPDISWTALWDKVWYESYDQPDYVWQSSASDNDFEPKFSFTPLAFGTLKAAFYAMLIATPLAICGAIYTAYFMAPALRRKVKPLIELMEALPTVILGFLAGLWLAPFIEDKLTGVFTVMMVMPVGILLFAFLWSRLPISVRTAVPEGWQPALLIPVICALGYLCFAVNDSLELLFFGGDMRVWITHELGISFDQRNAMVVGIAMGMAVIPTIFSISEDAIFSVPKHLSYGSLALGATPWQTLVGVVLPTASPGIFSGLMIGMGRAVGETMIVLMATGNTPIMDANIFEGMRTLAANIAVEVPEAEVASSHYRILFLAAFVLFLFTFVVNTAAELIRQRLRTRYGSL
ncbi:MAG: ABC transporter permease subunit [Proteobacteria bacterium]|nr:ABC transporter permease subunit [Pseudomonadota bacterium]